MSRAVWAAEVPAPAPAAPEPVPERADPFVVPDGTPDELLSYIGGLENLRPDRPHDPEAVKTFERKLFTSASVAADKILARKPSPEQFERAVAVKAGSLIALDELGEAGAEKQLLALFTSLDKAGQKPLSRAIRGEWLQYRLGRALSPGGDGLKEAVGQIKQFVAESPPGGAEIELARIATRALEATDHLDLAAEIYAASGKTLSASDNPAIAALGKKMTGAARRLGLVGKPMPLKGTFLDGTPLDWRKYEGKAVLVQFWATWCQPCMVQIENIRRNYDLYHDRGFEVIGVNLDDTREELTDYLKVNRLPWNSLVSSDPSAVGMDSPLAVEYGVIGIPVLILIGPDGNVVSLDARGPGLGELLAKLLGPAPPAKPQSMGR